MRQTAREDALVNPSLAMIIGLETNQSKEPTNETLSGPPPYHHHHHHQQVRGIRAARNNKRNTIANTWRG
ncbi:hypothetical protein E2C01_062091 [Portunus trituberculatus]|uniref:Uncharacterized protein n=1 Tax=Portunus trituberculatus TaxID=210409 RepID=A0A5B7HE63_PORTR|nr:hypothetical protein [Portunus trituberculatus]